MRPYRALAVLVSTALGFTSAAFDCKKAQAAGFEFDLSPLARDVYLVHNQTTHPTMTSTKYAINPCAPLKAEPDSVPKIDRCPENAWVCRSVTNYKEDKPRVTEVNAVAGISKSDQPTLQATASGSEKPKEFLWKMTGVPVDSDKWATEIKFICNKSAKNDDLPKLVAFKDGLLELEWSVPAACALGDSDDDNGKGKAPKDDDKDKNKNKDGGGKSNESSGGFFSTVFTLLASGFILYFVLGVMYRYLVVRASGLDLIPNRSFWREFPYLCADFAQHIWETVSGRRRGGYSVV
ncbi:type II membrane protein [Coemansia asiatica]|uniref:Autophagy-related protein 27 n=1 Tax=Coemansia asiatica TaxID=1052880 RepID=A0A9W7XKK9_9FUNG|nr:type II membrane protein [Coemansia asiatica]KAJ2880652.1 type II membrane protein [Coemansia asiatica]